MAKKKAAAKPTAKAAPKTPRPAKADPADRGWFTIDQMCEAFGVTRQTFHESVRPLLADADVRGAGGKGAKIRCRAAIDAWLNKQLEKAVEAAGGDPDLIGAGESPTKEELLKVKLQQERIKLATMERGVVPIADMRSGLADLFAGLRRASEAILNRGETAVADDLNKELDQVVERWRTMAVTTAAEADHGSGEPGTADVGGGADPAPQAPDAG